SLLFRLRSQSRMTVRPAGGWLRRAGGLLTATTASALLATGTESTLALPLCVSLRLGLALGLLALSFQQ
ncbi:MAG: hypothetical protein DMG14_09340, partial [Acidobacteria bacterium]